MIPNLKNYSVETSQEMESKSFSISMNAKAFAVLSSTLYSDKIGSIIRELATNAYDSHVAANNKETPFEIHLPDEFEPWFSIRDFGTGMTEEVVYQVYTTYFSSTKENTNDQVGFMGLGSKSVFAYTDSFSVTSVVDGEKSLYAVYTTSTGVPSISKISVESTDEPNGVEIKLSVKKDDYRQFALKVQEQLRFFKVIPNCINVSYDFKIQNPLEANGAKIVAECDGFKMASGIRGQYIVQGNVSYPLNIDLYVAKSKNEIAKAFARSICSKGAFAIEFAIGKIGVTASREAVEYTDLTISSLDEAFVRIKNELVANVEKSLASLKTNWDIACFANDNDLFGDKIVYDKLYKKEFAQPALPSYYSSSLNFEVDFAICSFENYRAYTTKSSSISKVAATEGFKVIYYIDEGCKYQRQRINILRNNEGYSGVNIINLREGKTIEDVSIMLGGFDNFVALSSVPYTPAPRVKRDKKKTSVWVCEGHRQTREWSKVEDLEDIDDSKEYAYVFLDRLQFENSEQLSAFNKWFDVDLYCKVKTSIYDVIGIRKKDEKEFLEQFPDAKQLQVVMQEYEEQNASYIKSALFYNNAARYIDLFIPEKVIPSLDRLNHKELIKLLEFRKKGSKHEQKEINVFENWFAKYSCSEKRIKLVKDYSSKVKVKYPILKVSSYDLMHRLAPEDILKYLSV